MVCRLYSYIVFLAFTAPTMPVLMDIVKEVRSQLYLRSSMAKFNAFLFGLLNAKALDHWLQILRTQVKLMRKHYEQDSLMFVFTTIRGRHLFNDTMKALRPLASLPFRIECNFEYKYKQTFSGEFSTTPDQSMARSLDSDGLPELLQKTDVRQYIQQAKDWIEGSKISESAIDYLGQTFYREYESSYKEEKHSSRSNRWSLPPIETMISLAHFFAKSPTEKPSPSLEEFAMYLARVQSVENEKAPKAVKAEKIIENGEILAHELHDDEQEVNTEQKDQKPVYKQAEYQFENRFTRVESEPVLKLEEDPDISPKKRLSVPDLQTSTSSTNQKRWSFGSGLINVFDKLLLDNPKQQGSNVMQGSKVNTTDLPKNMQPAKKSSPKNMPYMERKSEAEVGKESEEDDTPTPKASPIRTWKSVAQSNGQVSDFLLLLVHWP